MRRCWWSGLTGDLRSVPSANRLLHRIFGYEGTKRKKPSFPRKDGFSKESQSTITSPLRFLRDLKRNRRRPLPRLCGAGVAPDPLFSGGPGEVS